MPQRVLVTAGGSGIGLVIAQAFAAAGERVHVCDIDRSRLEAVSASSEIGTTAADVSDPDQVAALFDEVQSELGGLDVLVNNACLLYTSPSPRDGLLSRMPSSA